jgi:UTP--glucose-1-phosphate uridylyltransferase
MAEAVPDQDPHMYLQAGMMPKKISKAVLPVAGLGTRFLPVTKSVPKELLPVVDTPLVQYAIDEARDAGIEEFIFVNGRGKGAIEDYFDHAYELQSLLEDRGKFEELERLKSLMPSSGKSAFVRQQEPLGLGHAVWCAKSYIGDEPFAVILPDDLVVSNTPCLKQMVGVYEETGGNVVAVENVPLDQTSKYGILDIGAEDGNRVEVKGLVEKPDPKDAPSTLSIIGRYILLPQIMGHLDAHETGAGGEIQLTDAMSKMLGSEPFHGLKFEGIRYDCGSKLGFIHANIALAMDRPEFAEELLPLLKDAVAKAER